MAERPRIARSRRPPVWTQVFWILPEADRKPGGVSCSEGGGFGELRANDWHAQDICLELHQELVEHHAAIDFQRFQADSRVRFHRLQDFSSLKGSCLQSSARQVSFMDVAGQAYDHSARVRAPIR